MNFAPNNSVHSRLADSVRRVGFKKWYERELLRGHAHMILAFLSVIALLASMEAFGGGVLDEKLMDAMFVLVCAAIGLWAMRRYLFLLKRAEQVASQAVCPRCNAYGLFGVTDDQPDRNATRVRCRKCAHPWTIDRND